jgi:hypothetical protein
LAQAERSSKEMKLHFVQRITIPLELIGCYNATIFRYNQLAFIINKCNAAKTLDITGNFKALNILSSDKSIKFQAFSAIKTF